jgi:hypothetical protein
MLRKQVTEVLGKMRSRVGEHINEEKERAAIQDAMRNERKRLKMAEQEAVHHPSHFGGEDNPYETIKVLFHTLTSEEFLGFIKGNVLKYTMRAGKKEGQTIQQDLEKAEWYLNYLNTLERVKAEMVEVAPEEASEASDEPLSKVLMLEQAQKLALEVKARSIQKRKDADQNE